MTNIKPVHPGEILFYEFIKPLGLNQNSLSSALLVPANRINQIVNGKRDISADTALRLSKYFGTSEEFWMNLQNRYDLEVARTKNSEVFSKIHTYEKQS